MYVIYVHLDSLLASNVMFSYINLYVAIHDISVFIIKVDVLMHEQVHSCLHLSIVNKTLFNIHFIILCLFVLYI